MTKAETEAALKEAEYSLGEAMRHLDRLYLCSKHLTQNHRKLINRDRIEVIGLAVMCGAMAREIGDPTD